MSSIKHTFIFVDLQSQVKNSTTCWRNIFFRKNEKNHSITNEIEYFTQTKISHNCSWNCIKLLNPPLNQNLVCELARQGAGPARNSEKHNDPWWTQNKRGRVIIAELHIICMRRRHHIRFPHKHHIQRTVYS